MKMHNLKNQINLNIPQKAQRNQDKDLRNHKFPQSMALNKLRSQEILTKVLKPKQNHLKDLNLN